MREREPQEIMADCLRDAYIKIDSLGRQRDRLANHIEHIATCAEEMKYGMFSPRLLALRCAIENAQDEAKHQGKTND